MGNGWNVTLQTHPKLSSISGHKKTHNVELSIEADGTVVDRLGQLSDNTQPSVAIEMITPWKHSCDFFNLDDTRVFVCS